MKLSMLLASLLLLLTTACTTGITKDDVQMHFGDLPSNPFVIEKNKKGGN